jgi:ADP-ribose pyrophosphatase
MDKSPRIVFSTPWFEIEEIDSPYDGGDASQPYYRMNTEDGAMIVPLTADGEIICVRQYRPAIGRWTLELPSGGVDDGEEPIDAARRELVEETGFVPLRIHHLSSGQLMANRVNAIQHVFVATDCWQDETLQTEFGISVRIMRLDELKQAALTGEFTHYSALASLVMAHWRGYGVGFDEL